MAQRNDFDNPRLRLIYQLMERVFNDEALNQFSAAHFRPVFDRFTPELDKASKIRLLMEYCAQRNQLGTLVKNIEQVQPEAYQAFVRQVQSSSKKSRAAAAAAPAQDKALLQPQELLNQLLADRYRIIQILDRRGLGSVFKAHDTRLGLEVAIKIIDLSQHPPAVRDQVQAEARTAMQLNHPGIVQVYDFGQVDSLLYIVQEFVPGSNLNEMRRNFKTIDPSHLLPQLLRLAQQLCQTVDYIDRQGIGRPSLVPDNIMFKPSPANEELAWQPVLINFALLRPRPETLQSAEEFPVDRLIYQVSPELLQSRATDIRSDVYALGILLYDLFVGQPPFRPINLNQAVRFHGETPPPAPRSLNPALPKAVEQVILKALAKDPAARYPTAIGLEQALAECLDSMTTRAPVPRTDITILMPAQPLAVVPGERLTTKLTLHNEGKEENFCRVSVEGIPADWISIVPVATTLAPGESGQVSLTMEPPRTPQSKAGRHSFTIQVVSQEGLGQRNEMVQVLTVEPYTQFKASTWPQEISADQTAQVTIENQGNTLETFTVTPQANEDLTFEPDRVQIKVAPGDRAVAEFLVSPKRRLWFGNTTSHTFSFEVSAGPGKEELCSGQLVDRAAVRPEWAAGVAVAAVLLLCAIASACYYLSTYFSAELAPVGPPGQVSTPLPIIDPPLVTPTGELLTATPPTSPPTLEVPTTVPTDTVQTAEPTLSPESTQPPGTVTPEAGPVGPPLAIIVAPGQADVGQAITFDAGRSEPGSSDIVSYTWDFADGNTATGVTTTYTYNTAGNYRVTLTVTDENGESDQTSLEVSVINP